MAIYSLNHSSIGRSTHRAGTASAHVRYVSRRSAASAVLAEGMPAERNQAVAWLDQAEAADRKNARVVDKLMLALPLELSPEERQTLVRGFAQAIGSGRISWLAAIHDKGREL